MLNYAEICAKEIWQNDDSDTKFKMEEIVKYKEKEIKIIGVNIIDENEVEYALENEPYLVYEDELEKI